MFRFKRILFSPLAQRNNPAAVRRVTALVGTNGAHMKLLGVAPEPTRFQRLIQPPGLADEVVAAERARLKAVVRRLATRETDVVEVVVGDPTRTIIESVLSEHHDLVVVTSDEDRQDRTTIRRLLRTCPCPVWVIRPTRARTQRVLACVNPDPAEFDVNKAILELASSMVAMSGGELHVLHAWQLYGEATLRSSAFVRATPDQISKLLLAEERRSQQALTKLLDTALVEPEVSVEVHLVKGAPEDIVPELVAKKRINLVVMGTAGRTGPAAMIMGNTAERIIDDVKCSLIAVKPLSFVSPVKTP